MESNITAQSRERVPTNTHENTWDYLWDMDTHEPTVSLFDDPCGEVCDDEG